MTNVVNIIDDILFSRLREKGPGQYIFRGQADADWELKPSAIRRLEKNKTPIEKDANPLGAFIEYHNNELLDPARTNGFGIQDGREISDLELLGKLQHLGAATGLIDFTRDALTALWFAVGECRNKHGKEKSGKIFLSNLNIPSLFKRRIREEDIEELFSRDIGEPKLLYWEPTSQGEHVSRILRQQSIFILGDPFIPEESFEERTIPAKHKGKIRDFLATIGIDELSIFSDMHGFSLANKHTDPIRNDGDINLYYRKSVDYYQQGEMDKSISYSKRCIKITPNIGELYFLLGNAIAEKDRLANPNKTEGTVKSHKRAIKKYKKAERCDTPYLHEKVNGDGDRTAQDLDAWRIKFNLANLYSEIERYEEAIVEYNESIELDIGGVNRGPAYINRGNAKLSLRRYEDAVKDYELARNTGSNIIQTYAESCWAYVLATNGLFSDSINLYESAISNYSHMASNNIVIKNYDSRTARFRHMGLLHNKEWIERALKSTDNIFGIYRPGQSYKYFYKNNNDVYIIANGLITNPLIDTGANNDDYVSHTGVVISHPIGNIGNAGARGSTSYGSMRPNAGGFTLRIRIWPKERFDRNDSLPDDHSDKLDLVRVQDDSMR